MSRTRRPRSTATWGPPCLKLTMMPDKGPLRTRKKCARMPPPGERHEVLKDQGTIESSVSGLRNHRLGHMFCCARSRHDP
jgi:hypothetical protein